MTPDPYSNLRHEYVNLQTVVQLLSELLSKAEEPDARKRLEAKLRIHQNRLEQVRILLGGTPVAPLKIKESAD